MGPVIRNVIRDCIRPVMGDEALVSRLLLDKFTGAAAAYSLETLSVDTTDVVRVRRSSDDTEQDFTAAQVTDGTLTTFTGAGDGFVTTWYDQSGNDRDAVQATAASQPQIVASGALVTGGIDFDGVNGKLKIGTIGITGSSSRSFFAILNRNTSETTSTYIGLGDGGSDSGTAWSNSSEYGVRALGAVQLYTSSVSGNDEIATTIFPDSSTNISATKFFRDGSEVAATSTTDNSIITDDGNAHVGNDGVSESSFFDGSINAVIVYPSDQSSNRAAIEAKLAEIYGITLA